jgi:hypothetical protein
MTLVRKKLSKAGWIILGLIGIGLIAAPILHFTGVYPLDFLGDWAISAAMVGTTSGWIAGALAIGCGILGFGICYILKDYVIGIDGNLQITNNTGGYVAQGQTLSQTQPQNTEVT